MQRFKQQLIARSNKSYYLTSKSYLGIGYGDLWHGSSGEDDFLNYKKLTFVDIVEQRYAANELIYYPELALELRKLPEYPVIRRHYEFEPSERGLAVFKSIYEFGTKMKQIFEKDLMKFSKTLDELVAKHGQYRYVPIVDGLIGSDTWGHKHYRAIQILGVEWYLHDRDKAKEIHVIDFYNLFAISKNEFKSICVEEVIAGTPFVALRLKVNYKAKGRLIWYSLETCQVVKSKEIAAWQAQNERII